MMTSANMTAPEPPDAQLISACRAGDRQAFGELVGRYQSLVCSVVYSHTGSLMLSEDVAQETFLTAWKQLDELREPEKLRAWLCGIARNLTQNTLRRLGREPVQAAETLEAAQDLPAPEKPPGEQAISREEAAILWRSLERIPENYREPLVLFYREGQSVEQTAALLELNADTVKQRLSRGRKLLAEEVAAFVEGALARTNPGKAFTLGVLAALPVSMATTAKAASVAVATAKGGATVTGASLVSVLSALAGPLLGLLGGYLGLRASLNSTRTPRERALVIRHSKMIAVAVVVFSVGLLLFGISVAPLWQTHPALVMGLGAAITLAYAGFICFTSWQFNRKFARLREEERALQPEAFATPDKGHLLSSPWEYRSRATLLGLPLVHCRSGRRPGEKKAQPAIGWIACGEIAYGVLFANGAVAVGGISMGGVSVGIVSFGGVSLGLLALGGVAVGGVAMGGLAIGVIASGGFAIAWHAAIGGMAAAHELALGGTAMANHANDEVTRDFFLRYRWLDISQAGPRNAFWTICFAPVLLQMVFRGWLRPKLAGGKASDQVPM
ncbi:MAG: sigma-70 family RNA polymerase sigma factor [Proteobacteria bacterium]|nr:sigma-70 family RNA polymerase sigma factor [Pseudomonadota bacterium]